MPVQPQTIFLIQETRIKVTQGAEDDVKTALTNQKFTGSLEMHFSEGTVGYVMIKQPIKGRQAVPQAEQSQIWTPPGSPGVVGA